MSMTKAGHSAIFSTSGNSDCHVILRGGRTPNYNAESILEATATIGRTGQSTRLMVDCSHANSGKSHIQQEVVCRDVAGQISNGEKRIIGIMLESNLIAGRQNTDEGKELVYGQSITDACMAWDNSETLLRELAVAVQQRRLT